MADQNLTKDILNFLFDYKDGELIWKFTLSSKGKKGKPAGNLRKDGYKKVGISNKNYLIHRLIFLYHYGYLPEIVDHIDGNQTNNRIENLRPATKAENCQNQRLPKLNTSGYKNVSWNKKLKKWRVALKANNKNIEIGLFENLELAGLVAEEARLKYHGKFANHS